ncbi:MAG: hypothetical protein QXL54_03815 [Candidatus Bathyarchaeia archaeon]
MTEKKTLRVNPTTGDISVTARKGLVTTKVSFNPTNLDAGAQVTVQADLPDRRVVFVGNAPFKTAKEKRGQQRGK